MTTITAKELRDNLSETLKRVQNGEEIRIIYRSRAIGRIVPAKTKKGIQKQTTPGEELEKLLPRLRKHQSSFDPNKSFKELYDEQMESDPKYARYTSKGRQ